MGVSSDPPQGCGCKDYDWDGMCFPCGEWNLDQPRAARAGPLHKSTSRYPPGERRV